MPMKRKFDDAREQLVHVDVVTSGASQYSLGSLGAGLSFLQVKQLLAIASVMVGTRGCSQDWWPALTRGAGRWTGGALGV